MNEIWRAVSGYENYYEVSNLGRVRSVDREFIDKIGRRQRRKSTILKQNTGNTGYLAVSLSKNGNIKLFTAHRLVALAFLELDEFRNEVNHRDGNKLNNHIENLEWVTSRENSLHAYANGLITHINEGVGHPTFKGEIIATCLATGKEIVMHGKADIERKGFDNCAVYNCVNGKRNTHRGHTFRRISQ